MSIDRHAVVSRHDVTLTSFGVDLPRDKQSALQVGNGHLAFGMEVTGLQTFMLHGSFSHAALSDWCWHTAANPEGYRPEEAWIAVASGGRTVPYASNSNHLWSKLTPEHAPRSDDMKHSVAVRYAWADHPVRNLYNRTGLPGSPFRTDRLPGLSERKK